MKKSVISTFDRVGIPYQKLLAHNETEVVMYNRFGGGKCSTTPLVAYCIEWVYKTNNAYDLGLPSKISIEDFDRVRYFVLEEDSNAYYTCLD